MEAGSGPGVGVRRHLRKSLANRGKHPSVVWLGRIVSPGCDNRHCHADQKDLLTSHYMCFNEWKGGGLVGCCFLTAAWQIDVLFWPRDSGWGVMWWETSERDPNPERIECRWLQFPPALFTSHPFAVTKMALTGQILIPTLLSKQKPQLWSWNLVMGRTQLPVDRYVHSTGVLAFFLSTPECSFHIWKIHTGRKFTKMFITFVCQPDTGKPNHQI